MLGVTCYSDSSNFSRLLGFNIFGNMTLIFRYSCVNANSAASFQPKRLLTTLYRQQPLLTFLALELNAINVVVAKKNTGLQKIYIFEFMKNQNHMTIKFFFRKSLPSLQSLLLPKFRHAKGA